MDAAKTGLAADILHDMIFHSHYDQKELDRERGVIVEEINMYEDNPRMHIDDLLEEVLFPDSTLGWNIAGPRETIRTVPREKLIKYRDAYYIPERMAVCVAGKIDKNIWKILDKGIKLSRFNGKIKIFLTYIFTKCNVFADAQIKNNAFLKHQSDLI